MSENLENLQKVQSSVGFRYPKRRDDVWKCGDLWLEDRKDSDGAEGLWRIHDDLYDLTDFIDKHPGGKMWLIDTKGTDITEAFEAHHLSFRPEKILQTFLIRKAATKRSSPFTFHDDGFYRTLKKEIIETLENLPKKPIDRSNFITDSLCFLTFFCAFLANYCWSYKIAIFAGIFLTITTISAHNYIHKKDNFRMYYFDLSLMQSREWRITHVLSHHLFPNTIIDLEISLNEPLVHYLPEKKNFKYKLLLLITIPLTWSSLFFLQFFKRIAYCIKYRTTTPLKISDLVPYSLPISMYFLGNQPLIPTIFMWFFIVLIASTFFGFIGFNAAHHHPDIFHDGDAAREDKDFGLYQLDAVSDRYEITGSHFLVLTQFGDHALHHLFPTLDHGLLEHLYPIFKKNCEKFNVEFRLKSQMELVKGQFLQSIKEEPNRKAPGKIKE